MLQRAVAVVVWLLVVIGAAERKLGAQQLSLQQVDSSRGYVVSGGWNETSGHGRLAQRYRVRKFCEVATGRMRTAWFDEGGRAVEADRDRPKVAPEDKIAEPLLDQWKVDRRRVLRAVVWLVDRQARSRTIVEEALRSAPVKKAPQLQKNARREPAPAGAIEKHAAVIVEHRKKLAEANGKIIDAFVDQAKIPPDDIVRRYRYAPAIAVQMARDKALELANRADVRFIFHSPASVDELPEIGPAALAPGLWAAGHTGTGAIVAIVGESGPFSAANPFLGGTANFPSHAASGHATSVAGIIRSTDESVRGLAFDCSLVSASRDGDDAIAVDAAADWALAEQHAMILNISQGFSNSDNGKLNWSDIYFDYVVHAGRALCVKSAGNASNAGYVTSPGRGYNSLAVGNINDGVDVAWSDDGMNAGSSALNPETGGEKPEIAAYGTFVRSTTLTFPWVDEDLGVTGTSFAAPVVSGIAALCVSRDPTLAYEPEALKAMVLTSGVAHNVEGDARLSGLDGAGAALSTAASVGIHVESLMPGMFDPQHRYELSTHVPLTSGDPVRIVLVYSHPPDSESASPSVSSYKRSDLDLELYVNGLLVASSSFGQCNPFEIIDYPPSANGTARIKIVSRSWHSSVAVLRAGIAYASKSTLGTSP